MLCLLCQQEVETPFFFSHIFCLKKEEQSICQSCEQTFERIGQKHCDSCCKPDIEDVCADCLDWQRRGYEVDHISLYRYNTAMKAYFQSYKFQGDYLLRHVFAKALRELLRKHKGYCIVPVPVSSQTYEERGFNQVEGLLEAANCSYEAILEKEEHAKQSQQGRQERLQMKNHYRVKEGVKLPDKVLLVDDIYTTGATLLSIKKLLLARGVAEVKTISLCR